MNGAQREDLQHLTPEALAQMSNLGLVKRASRELEKNPPELHLGGDGTLQAIFGDGIQTTWPVGVPIQDSQCSCGATTVCRHRLMVALAWRQRTVDAAAEPPVISSPGSVEDSRLQALLADKVLEKARKQSAEGISIEICTAGEACPTARLPAATVRFWAGAAIEAARCDCISGSACEHIALAVWAFRQGEAQLAHTGRVRVQLGAVHKAAQLDTAPYHTLMDSLLCHGVAGGNLVHTSCFACAFEAAVHDKAVWLQLLLEELQQWSGAYAARNARYNSRDGWRLAAELALRLAAGTQPGQARTALGIGLANESEMDQLRLVSLGYHVVREAEECRARIILADIDTQTRFVLHHQWRYQQNLSMAAAARQQRIVPGVRLTQLATGQLLVRHAVRRADGRLTLSRARNAQNSLLPQAGDWEALRAPLAFDTVSSLLEARRVAPVPQVQARHAAENYVVMRITQPPQQVFYDPQQQTVIAVAADAGGTALLIRHEHRDDARNALDASALALSGRAGPLHHVAGPMRWYNGILCIEPWAYVCDRLVVPDAEPACGALAQLAVGSADYELEDELHNALDSLAALLGELMHNGSAGLMPRWFDQSVQLAAALSRLSFHTLARHLRTLLELLQENRANPTSVPLAEHYLTLAALLQLHLDAAV